MNRRMAAASSTGLPLITWVTSRAFRVEPQVSEVGGVFRMIVELTAHLIRHDDSLTHREAHCLVECAHKAMKAISPELGRDFGAPASDSLEHLFSASRHAARPTGISLPLGALEAIRAIDARRAAGRR